MKAVFIKFATLTILIFCKSSNKPEKIDYGGYDDQKILLTGYDEKSDFTDSLASISLKLPLRLDTFYKWEHYSCNTASGWIKYRFADKNYPQFAESGFYWTVVPDSTYQLNIWHKPIKIAPDLGILNPLSKKDTAYCYYHPQMVGYSKPTDFLFKEFKIINEKPFVISAFVTPYGYLTDSQTLFVVAETNLKSRELYFVAECRAKDTTSFIDNMYKSFLSIRIKENP